MSAPAMTGNGARRDLRDAVERALARGVNEAVAPAMGLAVGAGREVVVQAACGSLDEDGERPAAADTIYDLSSLTKPLATTAAILLLVADGRIDLDAPASEVVPDLCAGGPSRGSAVTVRRLLSHCSGLPAHERFWEHVEARHAGTRDGYRAVLGRVARSTPVAEPGASVAYSDIGFILLGEIVERVAATTLDRFVRERITAPLDVATVGFRPLDTAARGDTGGIAPCGSCAWRATRAVCGEVQDENAWAMGGVAGHAGLFGDLWGVHALVGEWIEAYHGRGRVLDTRLVRTFWTVAAEPAGSTWALGWDTPSPRGSTAGSRISRPAYGHLGFTGTSVWIDVGRGVHVILLTNRVHPDRRNDAIRAFRPRIHDLVFEHVERLEIR